MKTIQLLITNSIALLTLDAPNQPVNTMGAAFQADLAEVVTKLKAEASSLTGVIITSAKSTFFAGGDLKALMAVAPGDAERFFNEIQEAKKTLRGLETLGVPVVAAIAGSALGGGLELALSCHARICVDNPKIQIGFPECTLGLLPGAGGVVKSVRLMGILTALPLLTEGTRVTPQKALSVGWVTQLVASEADLIPAAEAFIAANPAAKQPWDDPKYKIPGGTATNPAVASMLPIAPAMMANKTQGNYPAPEALMAVAVESTLVDFETAMRIETRYFTKLTVGQVAKNLIGTMFFQLNEVNSGKSRPAIASKHKFAKVGILGAGMMGAGIAWASANKGIATVLIDTDQAKADKGKAYSAKLVAKQFEKNRTTPEKAQALLDSIHATTDFHALADCDLLIEAVFEDKGLKANVTHMAEHVLPATATIASNTSTLPISGLAKAVHTPERFVGLHFFSPVERMPLVEIIRGALTNDETVAKAYDFVRQIGKTPIVVNDSRGFYTSRVFGTFVNEGMALLGEGVPPALIENIATQCGMPVGPLAVLDEVSLKLADDVLHQELDELAHGGDHDHGHDHGHDHKHDHAGEHKHADEHKHDDHAHHDHGHESHGHDDHAHKHDHKEDHKHDHKHSAKSKRMPEQAVYVLEKMAHGFRRMGRAHGAGFYDYPEGEPKQLWDGLSVFARGAKNVPQEDIKDRILYIQAIETIRCLEEGVLMSTRDANIGSIFGWGFPAYTGGTAQFVNHVGVAAFVARAKELAAKYGERFTPPHLLEEHAKTGKPI
jgi:3-hydroxyacyl-CoA dehydrogenase / enoyl-CoA hydratase / 3-hydroxybutyryl-CoA epimerase